MIRVFGRIQYLFRRRFNKVARKAVVNFNSEVEEIIQRTLANEEIEEIVIQAVERVTFSLIRQYWFYVLILLILLLLIQSMILSFTLSILLKM